MESLDWRGMADFGDQFIFTRAGLWVLPLSKRDLETKDERPKVSGFRHEPRRAVKR